MGRSFFWREDGGMMSLILDVINSSYLCGSELRRIIWAIDKAFGSDQCIDKNLSP